MKKNNARKKLGMMALLPYLMAIMLFMGYAQLASAAGIVVVNDGDQYLEFGGQLQLQYHYEAPDGEESVDDLFFRRLRAHIAGTIHKDWFGKIQVDFGKATNDNEVNIKDAYLQYKGLDNLVLSLGNKPFPFAREQVISSKYQQLVEPTFVGDHNFGTPGRNVGLHLEGHFFEGKILTWGAAATVASVDPDANKLDFDTPVNRDDDWNEGLMIGARVDLHPFGYLKFSQGNLKREKGVTFGVAAYAWNNDDDINTYTLSGISQDPKKPDIDSASGFEVSCAIRGYGLSVDAEYNIVKADTVDPDFTGGMYVDGSADLKNWAVEGGYMIYADKLELVAGYEYQDADGYSEEWTRTSIGANYFFKQHDIKLQFTYRIGENLKGKAGADADEIFVQTQYVF